MCGDFRFHLGKKCILSNWILINKDWVHGTYDQNYVFDLKLSLDPRLVESKNTILKGVCSEIREFEVTVWLLLLWFK